MKKIVSYSLFGKDELYWKLLPALLRAHDTIYAGWKIHIYHDGRAMHHPYFSVLQSLSSNTSIVFLNLVQQDTPQVGAGALWRLLPACSRDDSIVLCRDIDSLPSPRERRAVDEFVDSSAIVHCISDSVEHNSVPMMTGMIGFKVPAFSQYFEGFNSLTLYTSELMGSKGMDQLVLALRVWPVIRHAVFEHRLSGALTYEGVMESRTAVDVSKLIMDPELIDKGGALVPLIGDRCKDIRAAFEFYDSYGSSSFLEALRGAERGISS